MSDIFISYSRKDSEQALALAEKLRAAGMDVWIDQHGLELASSWSKDIVENIEQCKAFVLLLSEYSLASHNVVKELSIASDSGRSIIPIEITHVHLTSDFKYALAGLQRAPISDLDGIFKSLEKLGIVSEEAVKPGHYGSGAVSAPPKDIRKALIVLPFEDLSPAGEDNGWFADGLAGELIDAFGHIKSLRILDRNTSIGLRRTKLRTIEIGKEFNTRYFIEGSVRKFGEQIKISVALLDIETGDYLWQESHRGAFKDIFDIQESVAQKVVEGLKLHLTKEEQTLVQQRGTENTEAYELVVKANEYFVRQTKEGLGLAIQLYTEAIKLDPNYALAYANKALALALLYRGYTRDLAMLDEGMKLVRDALMLKPDLWNAYRALVLIYQLQGNLEKAEETAKEYIRNAPEEFSSHYSLGFFYYQIGQPAKAIAHYEKALTLSPENLNAILNLVLSCDGVDRNEKRIAWAEVAIPLFERHLKLFPYDEDKRVNHAALIHFAGRDDEARDMTRKLSNITDGAPLFNVACLLCRLQDYVAGLQTFRKSVEAGFRNPSLLKEFLHDEKSGIASLKGTSEYAEVSAMVEKIETEQSAR
jgi:adenylate cyclase